MKKNPKKRRENAQVLDNSENQRESSFLFFYDLLSKQWSFSLPVEEEDTKSHAQLSYLNGRVDNKAKMSNTPPKRNNDQFQNNN